MGMRLYLEKAIKLGTTPIIKSLKLEHLLATCTQLGTCRRNSSLVVCVVSNSETKTKI